MFIAEILDISTAKMSEVNDQGKRASFMIADLLSDVSPSEPNEPLPQAANSSDSATGSDVVVNDVIDYCIQSPTSIVSRGRIPSNPYIEQRTNHGINFAAKTLSPRQFSSVKPGSLHHQVSTSSVFQEVGVLPGSEDKRPEAAAAACLSLERCVTPLQWQAVLQHAVYTAGQKMSTGTIATT